MQHIAYPKIKRLWLEEVEGIHEGLIVIQEKIDGANLSIRWDEWICVWSKTQVVGTPDRKEGFNGAVQYANNHKGIQELLKLYPNYRLFWEWLVRHSLEYDRQHYKHFYLFDILDGETWLDSNVVTMLADEYGIKHPQVFFTWVTENEEKLLSVIKEYAWQSCLWPKWEGVVIRNDNFVNKFWSRCLGKYVTEEFAEVNSMVFGGNKEHWEYSYEKDIVRKYVTPWRCLKLINKLLIKYDEKLEMRMIPEMMSITFHDVIQEEIWDIAKKGWTINFKHLNKLVSEKAKFFFIAWINGEKHYFDWSSLSTNEANGSDV